MIRRDKRSFALRVRLSPSNVQVVCRGLYTTYDCMACRPHPNSAWEAARIQVLYTSNFFALPREKREEGMMSTPTPEKPATKQLREC